MHSRSPALYELPAVIAGGFHGLNPLLLGMCFRQLITKRIAILLTMQLNIASADSPVASGWRVLFLGVFVLASNEPLLPSMCDLDTER